MKLLTTHLPVTPILYGPNILRISPEGD